MSTWVPVPPDSDFTPANLPFGRARVGGEVHGVVAIGDHAVDLVVASLAQPGQTLLELDLPSTRSRVRELLEGPPREECLLARDDLTLLLPIDPPAFTDFYSGIHHAENFGRMFRPDQPPLLPNYLHLPIGYTGRASGVVVSGTPVHRPSGMVRPQPEEPPRYAPCAELDFELELGYYVARGKVLGYVLVNDWSARDVQRFEYQPLGPFTSKNFATTVSPWLVLPEALGPYFTEGRPQDPEPAPHLHVPGRHHLDLTLLAELRTAEAQRGQMISRTSARWLYWSPEQQIAHLRACGTRLVDGELCASGTISGPEQGSFGSMLELAWRGTKPLAIQETGESRAWLQDGDRVTLKGYAGSGEARVGFGECAGVVLPAYQP